MKAPKKWQQRLRGEISRDEKRLINLGFYHIGPQGQWVQGRKQPPVESPSMPLPPDITNRLLQIRLANLAGDMEYVALMLGRDGTEGAYAGKLRTDAQTARKWVGWLAGEERALDSQPAPCRMPL